MSKDLPVCYSQKLDRLKHLPVDRTQQSAMAQRRKEAAVFHKTYSQPPKIGVKFYSNEKQ